MGGYLYYPTSHGPRSWAEGEENPMLVNYHRHGSFFYVPQDIDIKRNGTYGLKCHPKHWKAPQPGYKPGPSALQPSALTTKMIRSTCQLMTYVCTAGLDNVSDHLNN